MLKLRQSKRTIKLSSMFGVLAVLCIFLSCAPEKKSSDINQPAVAKQGRPWQHGAEADKIKFSCDKFMEPDAIYWPGYFWMWNGPLDSDVLVGQLRDMREHDARSVFVLPMPHEFRPDSTNNQLDTAYLDPEFFQRVKIAVEQAKRLGMNYWLYDEGGWPSGEACGQVTKDHPELKSSVMCLGDDGKWQLQKRGHADHLNTKATQRFLKLTHQRYYDAVGKHFGKTIRFAFTDEPPVEYTILAKQIPWTKGLGDYFQKRFGYRVEKYFDVFKKKPEQLTTKDMRVRADFFDCWSQRFVDSYFLPIQRWCRKHGILSAGHLGGEDVPEGAVKYGYGHILRTLRAHDVPGVDTIWRQIFPGKESRNFPLFASTAAHQIGSPYALTESFAAYGNGITLEQMKWITDYQYVRGLNLMVIGCYPLSTRDHLMCGLRPHFGTINPLWDHTPLFHSYIARLGYVLSCGRPVIETAVYYPVRDIWARGARDEVVDGYESLADAMLQNQCSFDFIDDDVLTDKTTHIKAGQCQVGPMLYRNIAIGPCAWLKERSIKKLAEFVRSGGHLFCLRRLPGTNGDNGERLGAFLDEQSMKRVHLVNSPEEIAEKITPLVRLEPSCASIRVTARKMQNGCIYFLWNQGQETFHGSAYFQESGAVNELDPSTGRIYSCQNVRPTKEGSVLSVHLEPGQSMLLIFAEIAAEKRPVWKETITLDLAEGWQARAVRQFDVGEHNYEIREVQSQWEPVCLGPWKQRFSEDFSGDVAYQISVPLKEQWRGSSIKLDLGRAEYAARVLINGLEVGKVIYPPWEITIPGKIEKDSLVLEIVVTNTLANLLTSERVRSDWKNRKGTGWPGPYDARAAELEKESRGGGLYGPVLLKIGYWQE